jgi:uncharacterized protein (TIGR01777 family)
MRYVITGATGLIGKHLIQHWLNQKHDITVIGRTQQRITNQFGNTVRAVTCDDLKSAALVVNLAGASLGDKRWTEAYKKEIISSRIESTNKLVKLLLSIKQNPPRLFNASAIGIYGLQAQQKNALPPKLDEDTAIDWDHPQDFLAAVGQAWEKAAKPAANVVYLRFGVVLAREGGALPKLVLPFKFFAGGPMGTGQQPFSWVTVDDVVRAIDFLAHQPDAAGPYNIVAPQCIQQQALAKSIAHELGRPDKIRMPAFMLKLLLGKEMAEDLLLEGQHVYPQRLTSAGFTFTYPTHELALHHLLHKEV